MNLYLDDIQKEKIGFHYVLEQLNINSVYGKKELSKISFITKESDLKKEFDDIEIILNLLDSHKQQLNTSEIYFSRIKNIDNILTKLELSVLDEVDIFEIKKFIHNIKNISTNLSDVLNKIKYPLNNYDDLFKFLDLDNDNNVYFHLYNGYSQELSKLRKEYELDKSDEIYQKLCEEELNVRSKITDEIKKYLTKMNSDITSLGKVDLLIAKAKLASQYNLSKPLFSNEISFKDMFNPYVLYILKNKKLDYQKIDLTINKKVSIITGSNMSGKSVSLKTILLNMLCFNVGIYPFAKESSAFKLDYLIYLSDELQDVENSLSTFAKEIVMLDEAVNLSRDKKGLMVFDEFARGTNPIEAKMIVQGLASYLNNQQAITLMSTHLDIDLDFDYSHLQVSGLKNVTESDLNNKKLFEVMDYSIVEVDKHTKVSQDAFKVISYLNINNDLYEYFKNEYNKEGKNE